MAKAWTMFNELADCLLSSLEELGVGAWRSFGFASLRFVLLHSSTYNYALWYFYDTLLMIDMNLTRWRRRWLCQATSPTAC